jgi:hypothetical protein
MQDMCFNVMLKEIDSHFGNISGMVKLKPNFNVIYADYYMRLCNFLWIVSLLKRTMTPRSIRSHPCRLSKPGSVVGIATGYGLDGPGIESR